MHYKVFIDEKDSGTRPAAAQRFLRSAYYTGQAQEVLPDVYAFDKALSTITGRANILLSVFDIPMTLVNQSAAWLWSGHGQLYPVHVHKRAYTYHEEMFDVHRCTPIQKPVTVHKNISVTTRGETIYDLARTIPRDRDFMSVAQHLLTTSQPLDEAGYLWADNPGKNGNERCPYRFQLLRAVYERNQRTRVTL